MKLRLTITKGRADILVLKEQLLLLDIKCYQNHFYEHVRANANYWKLISLEYEELFIRSLIQDCDQVHITSQTVTEIIKFLKAVPSLQLDFLAKKQDNKYLINLTNGVFNIQSGKLDQYDKEKYFTNCINFSYFSRTENIIAKATPESWRELTSGSFNESERELKSQKLLQFLGYLISNLNEAKKAFFLIGPESCGKSLILNLLSKVIGEELVSSVPFHNLGGRFNSSMLFGKHLNICSEISCSKIRNPDAFKALVGNDFIFAEFKGQNGFSFQSDCKLLTAGNLLPRFQNTDGSNAILDRMEVLYFDKSIPRERRNTELMMALYNDRNAIFSSAVDTLRKLINEKYAFTCVPGNDKRFNDYGDSNKTFSIFIEEMCCIQPTCRVHKYILWEAFCDFCSSNAIVLGYDKEIFLDKIACLPGISCKRFRNYGSNPLAGFEGISLKSTNEINYESGKEGETK